MKGPFRVNRLAPYAWVAVLGTALALSWWSLDSLGERYGMPGVLAAMISLTFDGGALVAGDQALRRAAKGHATAGVKLLMLASVGLSAWLNWQHAVLLDYPLAIRVLFAAPPAISGWLFELQLGTMRQDRKQAQEEDDERVPRFGLLVWLFHPWAALRRLSRISGSRLRSIPETVADWKAAPVPLVVSELVPVLPLRVPLSEPEIVVTVTPETTREPGDIDPPPAVPEAQAAPGDGEAAPARLAGTGETEAEVRGRPRRAGRKRISDEVYLEQLRTMVAEDGGTVPSGREVARRLSIGQDRAGRLVLSLRRELSE